MTSPTYVDILEKQLQHYFDEATPDPATKYEVGGQANPPSSVSGAKISSE